MKRRLTRSKAATLGAFVAVFAASVPAASASTGSSGTVAVTYSASSGCSTCRTLVLLNQDGKTPLTGLDLSSGSNGFIAEVVDSGVDPAALGNFSVAATMSNLYQYDSATNSYNCAVSVPSSAITLDSAPALLAASGLSSTVQPVFEISGDLSGILTSVLTATLGVPVNLSPDITGVQGLTDTTLTQAAEAGSTAPAILTGTLLGGTGIPMTLGAGGGGPFSTPAAPPSPSCTGNGTGATSVPVMSGTLATGNPLLSDAQAAVQNPTVTQLISDGYLSAQLAETLISAATGISSTILDSTTAPWAGILTSIEDTLTGTVTGIVTSASTVSDTYGSEPVMTVSAPGATPASYQGVLTVTLTSP